MKRCTAILLLLIITLTNCTAVADGGISTHPEKAIAYMDITFRCGCTAIGTGAMICSDGLITAAHNLVCQHHSKTAKDITFYFGCNGTDDYFYKYTGHFHYWYQDSFQHGYSSKHDIGYVRFEDEDVGRKTGWFAVRYAGDGEFEGRTCSIGAYSRSGELTEYSGVLSVHSDLQFTFNQTELPYGGEGAPVYIWRNDKPTVVGVYTSHSSSRCYARRVTKKLFDQMLQHLNITNVTRH